MVSFIKHIRSSSFLRNAERNNIHKAVLYHYTKNYGLNSNQIHLRIESDGNGLLLINASRALHLNPTAAYMAKLFLEGASKSEAERLICSRYRVDSEVVGYDYAQFTEKLLELIQPDPVCPFHSLDLDVVQPFTAVLGAPYRMDLALTYRCNNDCAHCYNARPRDYPELSFENWKITLNRLWEIGIPHIVFTGGEPTLHHDLVQLIAYSHQIGQITGLNTNGRRLSDPDYVNQLVENGLDHVQVTVESSIAAVHDHVVSASGAWKQTINGIKNLLDSPAYVMTNTTLLRENSYHIETTLRFLGDLGVPTVGLNALIYSGKGATVGTGLDEAELPAILEIARKITNEYNQRLIWYTPTQYCNFDPMSLELGVKGCTAAIYNMCIEPDGAVLPCQSYYQSLGNILKDPWDSIWNHELAVSLRNRVKVPQKCLDCSLLPDCGGGCPLYSSR